MHDLFVLAFDQPDSPRLAAIRDSRVAERTPGANALACWSPRLQHRRPLPHDTTASSAVAGRPTPARRTPSVCRYGDSKASVELAPTW